VFFWDARSDLGLVCLFHACFLHHRAKGTRAKLATLKAPSTPDLTTLDRQAACMIRQRNFRDPC